MAGRPDQGAGRDEPEDDASDTQAVRFGRVAGIVIILLGIYWAQTLTAHKDKPIFIYLLNAYGYFTPGIATMFLLGILWKRTTQAGALTAGILSIPLSLVLEWWFPSMPFMNRTGVVFWSCMLLCAAVSLLTKPKPASELQGLVWTKDEPSAASGATGCDARPAPSDLVVGARHGARAVLSCEVPVTFIVVELSTILGCSLVHAPGARRATLVEPHVVEGELGIRLGGRVDAQDIDDAAPMRDSCARSISYSWNWPSPTTSMPSDASPFIAVSVVAQKTCTR